MDADNIFVLYEHLSGEKCKLPEKSENVLRNGSLLYIPFIRNC